MKPGSYLLLLAACLALVEGGFLVERRRASTELEIEKPDGGRSFGKFDKDKDGKVDLPAFQVMMKDLAEQSKAKPAPEEAIKMMFANMDKNDDKLVSTQEFKDFKPMDPPNPAAAMAAAGGFAPMAPIVPMAMAGGALPALGGMAVKSSSNGLKCVAWRKTTTCVPSGPRDPLQDKDCLTVINSQESGFCECEGYVHTAAVPCGHDPVDCTQECGKMQKLHRESFGAGNAAGGADAMLAGPDGGIPDSKDPYGQALRYGQKAMKDVNNAVDHSNQLLGSARNMISKMMNLKPWKEITKLGKDAEEAGEKTTMLAKLARPYIYTQVEEKSK